jgi:oxygen-independent coproporphyrinogen III oxidase
MLPASCAAARSPAGPLDRLLPELDADLLRRYDTAAPRYTSYPTAREFAGDFAEQDYRRYAAQSRRSADSALSLYMHIPFCESPCFYCGCNRLITRDHGAGDRYIGYLLREAAVVAPLFDSGREVRQLHLGGGTPNFLLAGQLSRLIDGLSRHFRLSSDAARDYSVELDPRCIAADFIPVLARLGFNRASFGVQDFDPDVQRAVNRVQSIAQTLAAIEACREQGCRSINIDLLYGLPRQTVDSFRRTLRTVIAARPERVAVYGYAHLPQLFKAQRRIDPGELPDAQGRIALLRLAIEELGAAGYRYIGLDHFALPGDDLAVAQERGDLHRNFMGYTNHANCDLIGLGVSAISHIGDSFSQNHRDLKHWEAALDESRLPLWRGLALSFDDRVRADVIQRIMCLGEVEMRAIENRHGINFAAYFAEALAKLAPLEDDGLLTKDDGRIRATRRGRLLLRLIAMSFDRYVAAPRPATAPSTDSAHTGSAIAAPPGTPLPSPFSRVI